MVFNPNVPSSGQTLGETEVPIRTNFDAINTAFNANHIPLTTDSTGKHTFLQMPEQGVAPTTAANEGGVYTKQSGTAATTALFFREESDGSELRLIDPDRVTAATGTLTLPGGLIMKWGVKASPGTQGSVTFPVAFPTAVFQIQLTLRHNSSGSDGATVRGDIVPTITDFNYRTTSSSANTRLYWYALGN